MTETSPEERAEPDKPTSHDNGGPGSPSGSSQSTPSGGSEASPPASGADQTPASAGPEGETKSSGQTPSDTPTGATAPSEGKETAAQGQQTVAEGGDVAVAEKAPIPEYKRFIYNVLLQSGGRVGDYYWNQTDLRVGDLCVVDGKSGMEFGKIALAHRPTLPCQLSKKRVKGKIIRKASDKDIERAEELAEKERKAIGYCRRQIQERGLAMSLSRAHFTFDGLKAVFYFTSEGRIDFRDLVRALAGHTGAKVEMRQIGVRDEARLLGGCGPCGTTLCCSSFLNDFAQVSIRMAKDQSLSLNPAKISGVCGRLMCCLSYEHEAYKAVVKKAPKMGKMATAPDGRLGKVIQLNLLKEVATLVFEDHSKEELPLERIRPRSFEGQPLEEEVKPAASTQAEEPLFPEEFRREVSRPRPAERAPTPVVAPEGEDQKPKQKKRRRKRKRGGRPENQESQTSGQTGRRQERSERSEAGSSQRQGRSEGSLTAPAGQRSEAPGQQTERPAGGSRPKRNRRRGGDRRKKEGATQENSGQERRQGGERRQSQDQQGEGRSRERGEQERRSQGGQGGRQSQGRQGEGRSRERGEQERRSQGGQGRRSGMRRRRPPSKEE